MAELTLQETLVQLSNIAANSNIARSALRELERLLKENVELRTELRRIRDESLLAGHDEHQRAA